MILADRYHYPAEYFKQSQAALETALGTAPLYMEWSVFDPGPGASLDSRFDALPELTKKAMREHFPQGLVPNGRNIEEGLEQEEIEYTFTSGTTEERVINIWDQHWWDSSEAASWKLNAHTARLDYPQKEAKLASSLNVGISCEEDLPMEHRILGRRLYLNEKTSLIQWLPHHFRRIAQELKSFQPVVLEANPSLLARLAYWAWDTGTALYSPAVIVFTYEFPSQIHLTAIRRVFSSPFVSSYGSTETGFVMEQCENGLLHQNTDFCRIDFHPLKDIYGGPELGRILVTTFKNPWNSIVRFDVGDLVRLHPSGECGCGRHTGLIATAVEGRTANVTFTTSGDLVTTMALDHRLASIPEIRDYHFEQHSRSQYELQLMLEQHANDALDRTRELLRTLYGSDGTYDIRVLSNILPGPAGKFRRTQANFDFDQKGLFV
jgi:phenylacetate-coenzyme A ligase PaaK-like adenylate-forming protein